MGRINRQQYERPDPVGQLVESHTFNVLKINELPPFIDNTVLRSIDDNSRVLKFEKMARRSYEYRRYFQYLKKNFGMTYDTYLPEVHNDIGGLHTELHHTPFTMAEITRTVANKHIKMYGVANQFDVAEEVMELHYRNLVGLISVSPTTHELIHKELIDVHPELPYGYWKEFVAEYKQFMTEDCLSKVKLLETWEGVPTNRIPDILGVRILMLQYDGVPMYRTLRLDDHSTVDEVLKEVA